MYKNILVPLDGSKRAEMILRHVQEMAYRYQSEVLFLRVVEPPSLVVGFDGAHGDQLQLREEEYQSRLEEARTYLASLQGEFREQGINARSLVVSGPVVREIMGAAEQHGADIIAIASHGRSGLSRVFYGSVAAGILQRADRPLLIVRASENR